MCQPLPMSSREAEGGDGPTVPGRLVLTGRHSAHWVPGGGDAQRQARLPSPCWALAEGGITASPLAG